MAGKSKIKSIRTKYIDTNNKYHYKKSSVSDLSNPIRRDFYKAFPASHDASGDINGDGTNNILDVVGLINIVLYDADYNASGDMNGDGENNVLDIVALVNCVLANDCPDPTGTMPGADGCFNQDALNYGSQFDCCYNCFDCGGGNYYEDCSGNCFDFDYWGPIVINNDICDDGINSPIDLNCEYSPDGTAWWNFDGGSCIDFCQSPGSFCNFENGGDSSGKCDCDNICRPIGEVTAYNGDGVCQEWLQCTEFLYDDGDCECNVPNTECNWSNSGAGLCDCSGNCINPAYSVLIGNGSCQNNPASIDFNCIEFEFDGGDCVGTPPHGGGHDE